MLVPFWRGPRNAIPWVVAAAVALLTAEFVPGGWYIIAGAIAGSITAGVIDE
jgi:predicted branched-subunit amino acid permease